MAAQRPTLDQLEDRGEFTRRHLGPSSSEIEEMLRCLDLGSLDDLVDKAVPASIRSDSPLRIPDGRIPAPCRRPE